MQLRLRLHPRKCFVAPIKSGFTFLGYRIFPSYRRLDAGNVRRFKRRFRIYREAVGIGRMSKAQLRDCVCSESRMRRMRTRCACAPESWARQRRE